MVLVIKALTVLNYSTFFLSYLIYRHQKKSISVLVKRAFVYFIFKIFIIKIIIIFRIFAVVLGKSCLQKCIKLNIRD